MGQYLSFQEQSDTKEDTRDERDVMMSIEYGPETTTNDRLTVYYYPKGSPISKSCVESTPAMKRQLIKDIDRLSFPIEGLVGFIKQIQSKYFPFRTLVPVKYLGGGRFGKTYSVCSRECDMCIAIKIQKYTDGLEREATIQNVFASHGLALEMLEYQIVRNKYGVKFIMTAMPVLDMDLFEFLDKNILDNNQVKVLVDTIIQMLRSMSSAKLIHGDAHFGNIALLNRKIYFIDFGRSVENNKTKSDIFIDMVSVIRSANIMAMSKNPVSKSNGIRMYKLLCEYFRSSYYKYKSESEYGRKLPAIKDFCDPGVGKYEDLIMYLLDIHVDKYHVE